MSLYTGANCAQLLSRWIGPLQRAASSAAHYTSQPAGFGQHSLPPARIPVFPHFACSGCGRRNAGIVLGIVIVVGASAWIAAIGRDRIIAQQTEPALSTDDRVEVLVAAKDIAAGAAFTRDDLPKLVTKKRVPKDSLPTAYVMLEEDLIDKRNTRAVLKGETFDPALLTRGSVTCRYDPYDLLSLSFPPHDVNGVLIRPGLKVDVLAAVRTREGKSFTLTVLVEILVLAVDTRVENARSPHLIQVSLAVSQAQALAVALATMKGCHLELLIRRPGNTNPLNYDIRNVMKLIQELPDQNGFPGKSDAELPTAFEPAPRQKKDGAQQAPATEEQIQVLVAAKDLQVGTSFLREDMTRFVVKKKISRDSLPPAFVVDENEMIGKRLLRAVMKDETFNPAMVGKGSTLQMREWQPSSSFTSKNRDSSGAFITEGSRVDVLAKVRTRENEEIAFPLLIDIFVVAVDFPEVRDGVKRDPDEVYLSFSGTQVQDFILHFAKRSGCRLELRCHEPGKYSKEYDIPRLVKFLEKLPEMGAAGSGQVEGKPQPKERAITLPEGTVLVSVSAPFTGPVAGFVVPGSKLDVIACYRGNDKKLVAIPLLSNVLVVAIEVKHAAGENTIQAAMMSFALNKDQAKVLALAQSRGCNCELSLRHPNRPNDPNYDTKKVLAALKDVPYQGPPQVAPSPRAKNGEG